MTKYLRREIEPFLDQALKAMPVVVLTGMRQVGKSTLLQKADLIQRHKYITLDNFSTLEAARQVYIVRFCGFHLIEGCFINPCRQSRLLIGLNHYLW